MDQRFQSRSNKCDYDRETATGKIAMAASAHPVATNAAEKILRDGGNAIDAAIAIQFGLNVGEPMMTGIGGSGFFMVYHAESKTTKIFDGHTRAPKAAHPELFLDKKGEVIPFKKRSTQAIGVGIPGILKAMEAARLEYGSKPLAELIEPAAQAAEEGVRVNWVMEEILNTFDYRLGDHAKELFMPGGKSLKEGDVYQKKHLAKTFRILQRDGIEAFYEGEIGEAIISTLKELGGIMEMSDLKNYQISTDEPVWGSYREYEIASSNMPSAGGTTMLQILKILEGFNLRLYDVKSWEKYYLFSEAMRIAFSDKIAFSGDPEFGDIPLKGLLSEAYLAERRKLINWERRNDAIEYGNPWTYCGGNEIPVILQPFEREREKSETTHFTVTDKWGNIVACTSTVEHPFGSGIMVKDHGFILNNEMTDFDAIPGGLNEIQPGKRPVSCKTPTIIFKDGEPVLTLGSPGGPTIIGSVFQTIVHVLDFDMDLKEAIEEPRIFTSTGPLVGWESGISMQAKGELESKGFEFADGPFPLGNVQAIQFDRKKGILYGAADSSREGKATGLDN
ncbi:MULTISPECIES: gamma-glutamyltransferase [Mesobacillus]|uniref:Glutathione hydrolase proenzyme n=2 Tax=Mesobacillus TaxID=2675231 RepID=A0A0D6Z6Y4_9BACI|nr:MULTISPECIES: gamma-glutamyltransferase [Mesobacillus]KIY21070.1 gamma-glutamyltranspeptidase [Mesobacillus subterraneus]MDQ0415565.1 gamma-glutamyltranspeptidase/glutathione hydrolase [Mesobacillus stamsii]